jgi:hypothetical protein
VKLFREQIADRGQARTGYDSQRTMQDYICDL